MAALLFIYGTLKDTQRLASLLGPVARWRVIGPGSVRGRLFDAGEFPALTLDGAPEDGVPGLLLEIEPGAPALARLDDYEGVAQGLFRRRRCVVTCADGTDVTGWVYVYAQSIASFARIPRWPLRE